MTLSPARIAHALRRPAPTPEQEQVITAPLEPGVVVAGAGSGKTETMAARVVWLVANGHLSPTEVLGLTFTRKAAGELAVRVRSRLHALATALDRPLPAGEPTIMTYDAFSSRIVTEYGARAGVEPGRALLTPASSWQRAARLVRRWDGPMDGVESAPDTIVADVLDLHEQAAGHLTDLGSVRSLTEHLLGRIDTLPPGPRQQLAVHSGLAGPRAAQHTRLCLLPIVAAYRAELAEHDLADFATVAADAAGIALADPGVGTAVRGQYRVVLLDEYQDTSHAQLVLLRALFGPGHALTAVGDPFQSIYGWRGANADTLTAFAETFAGARPAAELTLRTSFRNASLVLGVANAVAEPLRAGRHHVPRLVARPEAPHGSVRVSLHHTAGEQAEALADQVAEQWRAEQGPPSVAVLVRKRDQIPAIEAALRERDLPVEVVGLDGLLSLPEVVDVVALLRLVADPGRGDAFMRLLTGPRLLLGPRDLDRLAAWVRHAARDSADAPGEQRPSIVEALDRLPPPGWLSAPASARLRDFAATVARLRSRLSRPVPDVVADAVRLLGLDVETQARAARTGGSGAAHLDRLVEEAAAFAALAPQAGLGEFLGYLDAAEQQERGLRRASEVHLHSRIQVLTVHAAKGLEWDVVAVAGLCTGVFPASGRTGAAWVSDPGTLPYPLRGDAARLPHLDVDGPADQAELAGQVKQLVADGRTLDLEEERRLAYVAVTRARHTLLAHGYRWGSGLRPLDPSPFLEEIAAVPGVTVDHWVDDPGERPDDGADPARWPTDLLGGHREAVEQGAALVRVARRDTDGAPREPGSVHGRAARWEHEVAMLLAERAARRRSAQPPVPAHLSASQLVALRRDPGRFADALRRPMPQRPRPEARRGTAFHAWVEQLYGNPQLLDLDELPGAADALDAPEAQADLEQLQRAFRASGWAERMPREVEAPFELVLDEMVVRGRADAVFDDAVDGVPGLLVVDWKTGPPPHDPEEQAARAVQLAVYRLAFAALEQRPVHEVRAAFHHVREGVTITGTNLAGEPELRRLVRSLRRPG